MVSEIVHLLSQPLTALHCALDLSLHRDQTADELRAGLQSALEIAETLRQRLLLVRALNDAADPGDLSRSISLNQLLRELHEDMLPLFQVEEKIFTLETGADTLQVCADRPRLMRALFGFVEYLFRYLPPGAVLAMSLAQDGKQNAVINITTASCLPLAPSGDASSAPYSCEIEIARRSFRAAGGDFEFLSGKSDQNVWRATLPLV